MIDYSRGDVVLIPESGSNVLVYGPITLNTNKGYDVGEAITAFDDVYADDFQNVADFLYLDDRDDLAELRKITGSGRYDPRTGLELIDDDAIPEWLLTKTKDGSDILRDGDGKPYIAVKTMLSLLMGAVRQLDSEVASIKAKQ